jgi:hypothetical protein
MQLVSFILTFRKLSFILKTKYTLTAWDLSLYQLKYAAAIIIGVPVGYD